jgi:hypothetical protein
MFTDDYNRGLHYNAIYADEGGNPPGGGHAAWQTIAPELPCYPSCTISEWYVYIENSYTALRSSMQVAYPGSKVGANIAGLDGNLGNKGDFVEMEDAGVPWQTGDFLISSANNSQCGGGEVCKCMADFASGGSCTTTGAKGWFQMIDDEPLDLPVTYQSQPTTYHLWDMSNRVPILDLATYYAGSNSNTAFGVETQGGFRYSQTDEVYEWSPTTTTLSSPLAYDCTHPTGAHTISVSSNVFSPVGGVWGNEYVLRVGYGDVLYVDPGSGTTLNFNLGAGYPAVVVGNGPTPCSSGSYPIGTTVQFAVIKHQATDPKPAYTNVWYWGIFIPAATVDLGGPDSSGHNGGALDSQYILGTAGESGWNASGDPYNPSGGGSIPAPCPTTGSQCPEWWRRDFVNAIVLIHSMHSTSWAHELDVYGPSYMGTARAWPLGALESRCAPSCHYYPLNADGTTGSAIGTIMLRGAEAAILMKNPIP